MEKHKNCSTKKDKIPILIDISYWSLFEMVRVSVVWLNFLARHYELLENNYYHQTFYRWLTTISSAISDSPYGDHHAYQQQMNSGEFLDEGLAQHYGQMSSNLEEIDGAQNSGSYAAGQQQRRIIREIIVWRRDPLRFDEIF